MYYIFSLFYFFLSLFLSLTAYCTSYLHTFLTRFTDVLELCWNSPVHWKINVIIKKKLTLDIYWITWFQLSNHSFLMMLIKSISMLLMLQLKPWVVLQVFYLGITMNFCWNSISIWFQKMLNTIKPLSSKFYQHKYLKYNFYMKRQNIIIFIFFLSSSTYCTVLFLSYILSA